MKKNKPCWGDNEFETKEGVGGMGLLRKVVREDISDKWHLRSAGSGEQAGLYLEG